MSEISEKRIEVLARARARRVELAHAEPSENARRRQDQVRRAKNLLRKFILDRGIEIKDAGKALGYESVFRLPRHLGPGKVDLEDLLAMTEYFEDFDPTAILRDVVLGVDEHPDETQARREGTIAPDGERVVVEAPEEPEEEAAPSAQEDEEIVVIQPDATAPPGGGQESEPSLDTDEGLRKWANRFGFTM